MDGEMLAEFTEWHDDVVEYGLLKGRKASEMLKIAFEAGWNSRSRADYSKNHPDYTPWGTVAGIPGPGGGSHGTR